MQSHEYRVVPAPRRGIRVKGARRPEDRFARAVESEINRMAEEGWEFVRSDTLPCERRRGWFSRPVTVSETLLVFSRPRTAGAAAAPARGNSAVMPPPAAHPPPVTIPPPGPVAATAPAPAATRFTPPPAAPRPANDTGPVALAPPLSVVEDDPPPDPRHAAE